MDLGELNAAQRQAVEHNEGPLLVVAGAGTGKTRVITQRIARLIQEGKARPFEVLALTFTEKAAREMAERLYELIGWQSYQVPVMTFHAFGAELLNRYAAHVGRSTRGGLLNETQKALLLKQHLNRVELSYYGPHSDIIEFLEGVVEYFGRLQNAGISPESYQSYVARIKKNPGELHPQDVTEQNDLCQMYSLYEAIKAETGSYDYYDQLQIPLTILQQKPNIAARLSAQYRYVMVDEYQDTNLIQDQLLRSFVGSEGNLMAVGDDDQAIYGFRGADIGNILNFTEHFRIKRPVALIENYRSGQPILDAAYRLIKHNDPERLEAKLELDKRLKAQHAEASIKFIPYGTATEEQVGVVASLEERLKSGESPDSLAVLSATHAPLRRLAKELRARQLPFALSTQVSIFEQPELNQLWYLLRWIGLQPDQASLAHVMLSRFMGWSAQDYRELLGRAEGAYRDVEAQLRQEAKAGSPAGEAVERLDRWRSWAAELPVSQLVYRLVFQTGVSDVLIQQAASQQRMVRVFEDLGQLLEHMQDYEMVALDGSLTGYLQAFPKPPTIEVAEPVGDSQGIQLLTVHASKGLEFDTVYLIGCTQRAWAGGGGSRGWEVPIELSQAPELPPEHEPRRLMYVAVTRARRSLILSAATQTAGGSRQTVTPFIEELLPDAQLSAATIVKSPSLDKSLTKLQQYYPLQQEQDSRLPFETTDGWLELGVGDLGAYDFCPYDFYLEKVLGIQQPYGPQLAFGTALHGAIQAYYQAHQRGEMPALTELEARLDELWSDQGYGSAQQAAQARQAAHKALSGFVTRENQLRRAVLGVELPIKLEIPEAKLRLRGRIDAYFQENAGVELRDFKTGRKTDTEAAVRAAKISFQLRTYALAYEEMTGQAPAAVTLDFVVTGVEGRAELSSRILQNHRAKLIKLAEQIRARHFEPKPSNVHQCAAIRYYGTGEREESEATDAR